MTKTTSFFSWLLATCKKRKRLLAFFAAIFLLYRFRQLYKKYLIHKLAKKITNDAKYCDFRIVIVGAGFAGIGMAIKLKQHGFNNFVVYDKSSSIGGTWYCNNYPGCACDVTTSLYSFSFETNYPWTRLYPSQSEILKYLNYVVDKYKIRSFIKLKHNINSARIRIRCDDNGNNYNCNINNININSKSKSRLFKQWEITIKNLETQEEFTDECDVLITGVGQLNTPKMPKFEGLQEFINNKCSNDNSKTLCHSCEWDEKFDFRNKRIGMIGTGPSGIQIGPQMAKICKKFYIFQRSISHCMPKYDYTVSKWWLKLSKLKIFNPICHIRNIYYRYATFLYNDCMVYPLIYCSQTHWFHRLLYTDFTHHLDTHFPVNTANRQNITTEDINIEENKWYRKALTPNFPFGTKRILLSDEWLAMLKQDNVELVLSKIKRFTKNGIIVAGDDNDDDNDEKQREIELDAMIMATGFESQNFMTFDIIGKNGQSLYEQWDNNKDIEGYYGILVNNFSNLFMLYGAHTNLGHNSIIFMLECQINYTFKCIEYMLKNNIKTIEVKKTVQDKFNQRIQKDLKKSNWAYNGVDNWYKNDKGKVLNNWPYNCTRYWYETYTPRFQTDFQFTK